MSRVLMLLVRILATCFALLEAWLSIVLALTIWNDIFLTRPDPFKMIWSKDYREAVRKMQPTQDNFDYKAKQIRAENKIVKLSWEE